MERRFGPWLKREGPWLAVYLVLSFPALAWISAPTYAAAGRVVQVLCAMWIIACLHRGLLRHLRGCWQPVAPVPDILARIRWADEQGYIEAHAEAVKWLRETADQGHADYQVLLGFMYFKGDGVPEDIAEAVKWWGKAADQGHAEAQDRLGILGTQYFDHLTIRTGYFIGEEDECVIDESVPENADEGSKWLRKAADQGRLEDLVTTAELVKSAEEREKLGQVEGQRMWTVLGVVYLLLLVLYFC